MNIDKLFINGNIYTMKEENDKIEAFGIKEGKIVFTGSNIEAAGILGDAKEVVDLEHQVIIPGLTDSHMHLYAHCKNLEDVNLETAKSITDVIEFMKIKSEKTAPGNWVKGVNFDDTKYIEGRLPTKADLDKISTIHPIIIRRSCLHVVCANSLALSMAGVVKEYVPEVIGTVECDCNGEPTGIVRERTIKVFDEIIPDSFINREEKKEAILKVLKDISSKGLTSVHTYAAKLWKFEEDITIYRELEKEGRLPVRVTVCLDDLFEKENYNQEKMSKANYGSYKLFVDGSLGARSAALIDPYSDDQNTHGILICSQAELDEKMKIAYKKGLQPAIHAIGDKALEVTITSIENVLKVFPYNGQRFRVIHAQLINDSLLERMKRLPLVVDIQPSFVSTDLHWIKERLGENRLSKGAYAWKTMLDAGLILTGGSDCPVVSYNPFEGIFASVARQDFNGYPEGGWYPEENLSVYESICLFSKNAAYATGEEDVKGTIENGKLADFIVIDRDPFLIKPLDILKIKVLNTFVGGEES